MENKVPSKVSSSDTTSGILDRNDWRIKHIPHVPDWFIAKKTIKPYGGKHLSALLA